MTIDIIKKEQQAYGEFNAGEIVENKPIGFPQDGGAQKPYSNLFYWAHAKAGKESTIGLHPHKGFEIMSVVLKGQMEHYDTSDKNWTPLNAGDVQLIRAGNGISHAEKMKEGAEMFQIWFDPGLNNTLKKPASYNNYRADGFEINHEKGVSTRVIKNENGPVLMDSVGISIFEHEFEAGTHHLEVEEDQIYSAYLIEGKLKIEDKEMKTSDFALIREAENAVNIEVEEKSKLFVISSPQSLNYETYYELSGW